MTAGNDNWKSFIAELVAAFPELQARVKSDRNVSPGLLMEAFLNSRPSLNVVSIETDLTAAEEYRVVVDTLLSNQARLYVWILNDKMEMELNGPVRIAVDDLELYIRQFSELNDNRAFLDGGDFIAFCPATKTIGMVFHDGGGAVSVM